MHDDQNKDSVAVNAGNDTFEQEVLKSDIPVVVDFWADWCTPCKMVSPVLDSIAQKRVGKLKLVKVDVDANPELSQQYGIMSIPNMKVFSGGKVVGEIIGAAPEEVITERLDDILSRVE